MLTIVGGAALAGWVLVRVLTPSPQAPAPRVAAAPPERPPPAAPVPTARQAAPAQGGATPAPRASSEDEDASPEAIVRDLDVLARAVREDIYIEKRAFPNDDTILDLPSVIQYVRAIEFWDPAFSKEEEKQ